MDINRKVVTKNAYRITNNSKKTCLRIRVPGGHLSTEFFPLIQSLADDYGNGTVHLTARQGFEVPDIDFEHMDEINVKIKPLIEKLNLTVEASENGYPAAGTRNISACIGNNVCPMANNETSSIAKRIERAVYPNDFHFKIAVTGCPNDCIKAHMQDFGIICTTEPQYDPSRCITCEACVNKCSKSITGALTVENFSIKRDAEKCLGCGECVNKCPTGAWTRSDEKYFSMVIMGRTGKKNPRIARPFLKKCTEEVFTKIIVNTYDFVDRHIDRSLPKEHIGYIVDRVGYSTFRNEVLEGVTLNEEAQIAESIQWGGYWYKHNSQFE